jgi:hypothetical protein
VLLCMSRQRGSENEKNGGYGRANFCRHHGRVRRANETGRRLNDLASNNS